MLNRRVLCALWSTVPAGQRLFMEASTSGRMVTEAGAHRCMSGFSQIAEHEKGKTRFSGFYRGGFYVNNVQVPGSVMASSDLYMMWRPRTLAEVTPESLMFLELLKPAPEVLVLGCGQLTGQLPPAVQAYLQAANIRVEVLDSRNATGYFNVMSDEGRVVVGALLALDPSVPLLEVMPTANEPLWERQSLHSSRGLI